MPGGRTGGLLKMAVAGAGLAGAVTAGTQVTSAMADVGGGVEAAPMEEGTIPGSLLDRFSSILDKFSQALNSLGTKTAAPKSSSSSSSSSSKDDTKKPPPGTGPGPGGGVNAGDITADTAEESAFIATVREAEGTAGAQGYNTFFGGTQYGGDLSGKTVTEVKQLQEKFRAEGRGRFYDKGQGRYRDSAAVGAGQFMYPEQIVRDMGMDPDKVKFTPELQNQMILYLAKKKRGVDVSKELTAADFKILQKEWSGFGEYYGQGGSLGRTAKLYAENLKEARGQVKSTGTVATAPQKPPTVATPPPANVQQLAQTVSQPPQNTAPPLSVAPIDLSSTQTQSTKVGDKAIPAPVMSKGGVTVPFFPSSNSDNFLTLYSRIVYNIIDG